MIKKYYEEELRYLYESGKEFAKAHPDRAQFLNIDAVGDRDPYVERLFEGFAFLAARIREKLDDSFPELTEGLLNLMWPQFLHEIPSMAIAQFTPRKGILQEARQLPRGSEILSGPVGAESTLCRFSTTQNLTINPLHLVSLDYDVDPRGNAKVRLNFMLESGIKWENCSLDPIQLYLFSELPIAMMLHNFFTNRITKASLSINDDQAVFDLDPSTAVMPGGISLDETILPGDPRMFKGYTLLLEYFTHPEKFLFINLHGAHSIPAESLEPESFSFTYEFKGDFDESMPFSRDNFRLHCSPIVNLYQEDIEPIIRTGLISDYKLIADAASPQSTQVHSIESIVGIDQVTGERYQYESLYTFKNITGKRNRTYSIHYKNSVSGKREPHMQFGGEELEKDSVHEESISIHGWCTNGIVPREELRENTIKTPGPGFPEYLIFENITRPSLPFSPPDNKDYPWIFLSHLASNHVSLANPESLKGFLRLYNWSGMEGRERLIDAITDVEIKPSEMILSGGPIRGMHLAVSIQSKPFSDIGDLHLFGQILHKFFTTYISMNTFITLDLILRPSGKILTWKPTLGERCTV